MTLDKEARRPRQHRAKPDAADDVRIGVHSFRAERRPHLREFYVNVYDREGRALACFTFTAAEGYPVRRKR